MKKSTWICIVLTALCVVIFYGYRIIGNMSADSTAPKITIDEALLQVSVNDGEEALLTGVTANDDRDGDVSSSIIVESVQLAGKGNKVKVSYAAFDSAGNVAKAEREVEYTDYESPRFTLNSSFSFSQNSNFDVLGIIKVNDLFDGDISHRVRATTLDDASISSVGVHDVEFRVTNSVGDTVDLVLPVEVYSQGSYNASLSLKNYLIYLPTGAEFDENDYLDKFTVNGESTDVSGYLPLGFSSKTQGHIDTSTPGVYSISYYVTYERGSDTYDTSYRGFAKLIVVVEDKA